MKGSGEGLVKNTSQKAKATKILIVKGPARKRVHPHELAFWVLRGWRKA